MSVIRAPALETEAGGLRVQSQPQLQETLAQTISKTEKKVIKTDKQLGFDLPQHGPLQDSTILTQENAVWTQPGVSKPTLVLLYICGKAPST